MRAPGLSLAAAIPPSHRWHVVLHRPRCHKPRGFARSAQRALDHCGFCPRSVARSGVFGELSGGLVGRLSSEIWADVLEMLICCPIGFTSILSSKVAALLWYHFSHLPWLKMWELNGIEGCEEINHHNVYMSSMSDDENDGGNTSSSYSVVKIPGADGIMLVALSHDLYTYIYILCSVCTPGPVSSAWVVWHIFRTINEISWTVSETYQESTFGEFLTKEMMNMLVISGWIYSTILYIYSIQICIYCERFHISSWSVVVANQFQKTASLIHPLGIYLCW